MFEIQEEKQPRTSNMFDIPDLSSQTGTGGFDLGGLSAIEESSMVSNESFDISVHQSDQTDSIHSDSSFLAELQGQANAVVEHKAQYQNILSDEDDDDEDLEDEDDDEARTMELTGTFDMGAIQA
ncbi:hypothetical protein FBU59_000636, partial [Linderina macrospora]